MAAVGAMRGKAPKLKGNAERGERREGESLDAEEDTKAGWMAVGAALVGGTRMGTWSEWGVAVPLRLPAASEDGEEAADDEGDAADVDESGV